MHKLQINLVWVKKDFRIIDNELFVLAEDEGKNYLIFTLLEPCFVQNSQDKKERYWDIFYKNACEFKNLIYKKCNAYLHIVYGEIEDVIFYLSRKYKILKLISYREHGTYDTFLRDKRVHILTKDIGINFVELSRDCISRGSENLHKVDDIKDYYYKETIKIPKIQKSFLDKDLETNFSIPDYFYDLISKNKVKLPVGEIEAIKVLDSFIKHRSFKYLASISKPYDSLKYSSRLSHFISYGNLTPRYIIQRIIKSEEYFFNKKNFDAFINRLFWRRHFIQKFEKDCYTYEFKPINKYFSNLPIKENLEYIERWKTGNTGIPIIDACMRQLINEGWINFRMRAMLVSFFVFYLEQDWRQAQYYLANLFIDYEPGIHFPQIQMQAGITGFNTIRLYNPIKQSIENDPNCLLIKKWIPNLSSLPNNLAHAPWKLSLFDNDFYNFDLSKNYMKPIINIEKHDLSLHRYLWDIKNNTKKYSKKLYKKFLSLS